jgi:hypothetical protein
VVCDSKCYLTSDFHFVRKYFAKHRPPLPEVQRSSTDAENCKLKNFMSILILFSTPGMFCFLRRLKYRVNSTVRKTWLQTEWPSVHIALG